MPFTREIKETALVKSRRRCCVCHEFGGRNLDVHHIIQEADGGPNELENAIVLCFRCHAEAGHYNPRHPKGNKYSPSELRKHRDEWWGHCETHPEEIKIDFKSVSIEQDVHIYRLRVTYTNLADRITDEFRIEILFPQKIPLRTELGTQEIVKVGKQYYKKISLESNQRVFPGQAVEIICEGKSIEYEMNDELYFDNDIGLWELIWHFYTANAQMIEGKIPWGELHKF